MQKESTSVPDDTTGGTQAKAPYFDTGYGSLGEPTDTTVQSNGDTDVSDGDLTDDLTDVLTETELAALLDTDYGNFADDFEAPTYPVIDALFGRTQEIVDTFVGIAYSQDAKDAVQSKDGQTVRNYDNKVNRANYDATRALLNTAFNEYPESIKGSLSGVGNRSAVLFDIQGMDAVVLDAESTVVKSFHIAGGVRGSGNADYVNSQLAFIGGERDRLSARIDTQLTLLVDDQPRVVYQVVEVGTGKVNHVYVYTKVGSNSYYFKSSVGLHRYLMTGDTTGAGKFSTAHDFDGSDASNRLSEALGRVDEGFFTCAYILKISDNGKWVDLVERELSAAAEIAAGVDNQSNDEAGITEVLDVEVVDGGLPSEAVVVGEVEDAVVLNIKTS